MSIRNVWHRKYIKSIMLLQLDSILFKQNFLNIIMHDSYSRHILHKIFIKFSHPNWIWTSTLLQKDTQYFVFVIRNIKAWFGFNNNFHLSFQRTSHWIVLNWALFAKVSHIKWRLYCIKLILHRIYEVEA